MAREKQDSAAPEIAALEYHLTVIHPFDQYRRGDLITNSAEIEAIKAGPNSHHCHKIKPQ